MSEPTLPDPTLDAAPVDAPVVEENNGVPEGANPAWKPFMDVLPTSLYPVYEPVLKEWDRGVQERFAAIHSKYDPYQAFVDSEIPPEVLQSGYELLARLQDDPKSVVEAIIENFQIQLEQESRSDSSALDDEELDTSDESDPRYQRLETIVEQMAAIMVAEREELEAAEGDQQLDTDLAAAKEKYGEFDPDLVLPAVANGLTVDEAAKRYTDAVKTAATSAGRPPAPTILGGSSGAIPQTAVDVTKLTPKDTRALVVERLRQAASSQEG